MRKWVKLEQEKLFWEGLGGVVPEVIGDSSKVKSKEDLLAWLYLDSFWTNYHLQDYSFVSEMIMMDCWTMMDVKIFHTIGMNIIIDNISYFDKDEMLKEVGCGDTQFRTSIGKLEEANIIEMLDNGLEKRTHRLCKITPAAYWKGNLGVRNIYVQNWYAKKTKSVDIESVLVPKGVVVSD